MHNEAMQGHYLLHIIVSHQEFSLKFVLVTYPSFMETCKQLRVLVFGQAKHSTYYYLCSNMPLPHVVIIVHAQLLYDNEV